MRSAVFIILAMFIIMQFIRPKYDEVQQSAKDLEIVAPNEIMTLLKNACYDCHSNSVNLPWYSSITPISLMVARNVNDGRKYLNFSIWNEYSQEQKDLLLKNIFRTVYASMPPSMYKMMHKKADLSKDERKLVRDWIGYSK